MKNIRKSADDLYTHEEFQEALKHMQESPYIFFPLTSTGLLVVNTSITTQVPTHMYSSFAYKSALELFIKQSSSYPWKPAGALSELRGVAHPNYGATKGITPLYYVQEEENHPAHIIKMTIRNHATRPNKLLTKTLTQAQEMRLLYPGNLKHF
ncbi:MAG: hypothetical protein ACMXYD_04790 [Candidatus Woesearchaeota archaeon]